MVLVRAALSLSALAGSLYLAILAVSVNSGAVELARWQSITLSQRNFMFYLMVLALSAAAGVVSHRAGARRGWWARCGVLAAGVAAIVLVVASTL